eukprot:TRINITY_DN575_c0_g1_i1.p1 TRINITY_DN575_c0_g1~~TRINITY_DN575_c0_g1_i1.p1  ORF type:complete len:254 (+),score=49.82 TRINITY_DN575_c0_g1_i1:31-762(+)
MDNNILQITPTDLIFLPPYNKSSTQVLRLKNTSEENAITFKLKTTAPKRYSVKPTIDYILPKETKEVYVTLQSQKDTPAADASDSFQILCFPIETTISQPYDLKSLWEGTVQTQLPKYRVRSRFSPPDSNKKFKEPSQESGADTDIFKSTFNSPEQMERMLSPSTGAFDPDNRTTSFGSDSLIKERDDLKNKLQEEQRRISSLISDLKKSKDQTISSTSQIQPNQVVIALVFFLLGLLVRYIF